MATATVKVVMRSRPNSDGTHPLVLKIVKNRVPSIISIGQSIDKKDWDAKKRRVKTSHPNSARLNNLILKKIAEVNNVSLDLETNNEAVTAVQVKETVRPPAENMFFAQAFSYLEGLRHAKKYNQYTADKPRIRHFKEFMLNPKPIIKTAEEERKERQENKKLTEEQRNEQFEKFLLDKDIPFSTITPGLLDKFTAYLKTFGDKGKRTIINHLVVIRSVYAHADKNNVIDSKNISPFGKDGIKIKFPASKKEGLNEEEVKRLEEVELSDPRYDHARNIWLFNYYFAG
ncbi:MAG TPA: phage integrase SAM-like domain-containing protein, partial [Candidatus Babeliaceae bacterium]|nr:phage integrase SAM-like domain-containing protein [Candidatus Babeliaceae bacterium]